MFRDAKLAHIAACAALTTLPAVVAAQSIRSPAEANTVSAYPVGVISFGNALPAGTRSGAGICAAPASGCVRAPDGRLQPLGLDTDPVLAGTIGGTALIRAMSVSGEYRDKTLRTAFQGSEASLQLNAHFFIEHAGRRYFYWIQNIAEFDTSKSTLYFMDNAWTNGTSDSEKPALAYEYRSMHGQNGYAFPASQGAYYYIYGTDRPFAYRVPLELTLADRIINGAISFQYEIGGSAPVTYDRLTITMPHTEEGFFTSGDSRAPKYEFGGIYTALLFAGPGGHEAARFSSMSASLSIFYGTRKGLLPYTEVQSASVSGHTVAYSTGESVTDLQSALLPSGSITVTMGNPAVSWYSYGYKDRQLQALARA